MMALHPREVGVVRRRRAAAPAPVAGEALAAPRFLIELRVGEYAVGAQVGVAVFVKTVAARDVAAHGADGEVHSGQPPGGVVGFLPVDGDFPDGAAFVFIAAAGAGADEFGGLNEHAGRAAAGVIDAPAIGLEHFDEQPNDGARGVELAAALALRAGEALQEVLIDAPEDVARSRVRAAHADVAYQVDEPPDQLGAHAARGVYLRERVAQVGVVALYGAHGVIDHRADVRAARGGLQTAPARLVRHPENVVPDVLVAVVRVYAAVDRFLLGDERGAMLLEAVGYVFQEDEAKRHALVFGGVHVAAHLVRHAPQLGFVFENVAGGAFGSHGVIRSASRGRSISENSLPRRRLRLRAAAPQQARDVAVLPRY